MKSAIIVFAAMVWFPFPTRAATPVFSLGNALGNFPSAELLATNGWLYGTTFSGGSNGNNSAGTVFKLSSTGTSFTVLKTFANTNRSAAPQPLGGLILDGDTLYGTASRGAGDYGSVFKVNTDGTGFTELYTFGNSDSPGSTPQSGLLRIGHALYGTTYFYSASPAGFGTLFKIETNGSGYQILNLFTNQPSTIGGVNPSGALASDGSFIYGTANGGGAHFFGVVYKIGTDGTAFSVIHHFEGNIQGASPVYGVIHSGGTLYGVAGGGVSLPGIGAGFGGIVYKLNTDGSGYAILHSFTDKPDGKGPVGKLLLVGGTLYGVTATGGTNGTGNNSGGTLFRVNTDGSGYAVIDNFTNSGGNASATGYWGPRQPLTGPSFSEGKLFGTTQYGGTNDNSTVYALTPSPPTPPLLQFAIANNAPVLFWPDEGFGWNLQKSADLVFSNWSKMELNWTNGRNIGLSVSNSQFLPAMFFRLESP